MVLQTYEPCPCRTTHGDIEHLYEIDLVKKEIREISKDEWSKYDIPKDDIQDDE